jgi:nucleotide-binding universal stress UspA family protein
MKNILLHIHDDAEQDGRLQAAIDVARATGGHLRCLQVTPFQNPVAFDPLGGMYMIATDTAQIREAEVSEQRNIESKLTHEDIMWDWQHMDGEPIDCLLRAARLADIVVLSLPSPDRRTANGPLPIVADVVTHCHSCILALPSGTRSVDIGGRAVVAWDGSNEAAVALSKSIPMLSLAREVHVVTIEESGKHAFPSTEVSTYLSRHGIASELHEWPRKGRTVEEALVDALNELKASWLVMGAFGHSRLRETVFGGVTRYLLTASPVPLLLAH